MLRYLQSVFHKSFIAVSLFIALQLITGNAQGQIATFPSTWTGTPTSAPASVAANVNTVSCTRGTGLTAVSSTARFNSSGWQTGSPTLNLSANTSYLTFSVTAAAGYTLNLNSAVLSFSLGSSGTGPVTYGVYSSIGGFTSTASQIGANLTTSSTSVTFPSTGYSGLATIEIRIYGWGGTSSGGTGGFASMSLGGSVVGTTTNYYSKSTGALDAVATWTTDPLGGAGTAPTNFTTAGQIFNVSNGNPGTIGTTGWAVSGTGSKIVVNGTDLTITSTKAIAAATTIDVNAGRKLTIQNSTLPTFGVLDPTSTIEYQNTSSNLLIYNTLNTYGNIVIDGASCSVTNPSGSQVINFAGNFTLSNGATFNANNISLATIGTANQVITAYSGATFVINNLDNNSTNIKSGKLDLGPNTHISVNNSIKMNSNTGAGVFSDNGDTINVAKGGNVTLGGVVGDYNLTGSLLFNGASSSNKIEGDGGDLTAPVAVLNNIIIATTGSGKIQFEPVTTTSVSVTNIKGTLSIIASGDSVYLNGNTLNLTGNMVASVNKIALAGSGINTGGTIQFSGSSAQSYSGLSTGITVPKLTMATTGGAALTLGNNITVAKGLTLTTGNIITGTNTLYIPATGTVTGANAASYINGKLNKIMPSATTSILYEVGDATYAPVKLSFPSSVSTGSITVTSTAGLQPNIDSSYVNAANAINHYWTINNTGVSTASINVALSYSAGDILGGGSSNSGYIIQQYAGSAWIVSPAITNSTSGVAPLPAYATTTTGVGGSSFSGDYIAGAPACSPSAGTAGATPSSFCGSGTSAVTVTGITAGTGVTYQWLSSPTGSSASFSTIAGATSATYNTPTLSANTYYECSIGCVPTGTSTVSASTEVISNPLPTPTISGTSTITTGASAVLTFSGNTGDVIYYWNGAATISTTLTSTSGTVTVSPTSTTTYSITSATSAAGCTNAITGQTATITVSAAPSASIAGTTIICPSASAILTFSGTAGAQVNYTNGVTTYSVTLSGVSGIGSATVSVTPAATTTYSLTTMVSGGTYTISGTATITISNPVITSMGADASVCEGNTLNLITAISGGTAPYTYSWIGSNSYTNSSSSSALTNSVTVNSISATPSNPLYTVTVTDNIGCIATGTNTVTTTVNPLPVAAAITGTTTVCAGAVTTLADATTGGAWSSGSPSVATVDAAGNVTGVTAGTALISYTATNSCGNAYAVTTVTVTSTPAAGTITGAATVCLGSVITLADGTGGTWASSTPAVASVDGSGNVAGITLGTTIISYTTSNICGTSTATTTVTVNTTPATPAAITGTLTTNVGSSTTLSDATPGGTWVSAATSIATVSGTGVVSGVGVGSAAIIYSVTNTCGSNTVTATVTVSAGPFIYIGTSSTAWLTTTNWTGGVAPGASGGITTAWAQLQGTEATLGINMNGTLSGGTGNMSIGAIEMSASRTAVANISNSSTSKPGVLTLNGTTVNGVPNTILANSSSTAAAILNFIQTNPIHITLGGTTNLNILGAIGTTSVTTGASIDIVDTITGTAPLTFLGNGTWNGTTGNTGGLLQLGAPNTFTGGITVGKSDGTSNGVLELDNLTAMKNVAGNNITVNNNSQLFLPTAGTYAAGNITLNLNGYGNQFTTTGLAAVGGAAVATTWAGPVVLQSNSAIYAKSGGTLTFSGNISGTGSVTILGKGTVAFSGTGNTWTGGTIMNNGTLTVDSGSSLSTGPLTFAQLGTQNPTLNLNNASQTVSGLSSSFNSTTGTIANTLVLGTGNVLTINQSGNTSFGVGTFSTLTSVITGTGKIIKSGAGVLTFTGTGSTFTGGLRIDAGEIRFNPLVGTVAMTGSTDTLNGGAITTTGIAISSVTATISMGALVLTNNSTIDLGTAVAHSLKFAASNTNTWTSGKTLQVTNWTGSYNGTTGTKGQLFVGANNTGLTTAQLAQIQFIDASSNVYAATQLSTGEIVPAAPGIVTTATSYGPFCNTSATAISVAYTASGTLTGNYKVQLSNADGSFPSTTTDNIISTATSASPIAASIPAATTAGTIYRIRVINDAPVTYGSDNGTNIIITGAPSIGTVSVTPGAVCSGALVSLDGSSALGAIAYSWAGPGGFTSTMQSPTAFAVTAANAGVYTLTVTNGVCAPVAATTASLTVYPMPSVTITSAPVCEGNALTLVATPSVGLAPYTYGWSGTGAFSSTAVANPSVTGLSAGNPVYTVTVTDANTCSVVATTTATVNPLPTPTISGSAVIASGGSAVLTFSGNDGDVISYAYGSSTATITISGTTATVTVMPAGTTTYSITGATSAAGCTNIITGQTATVTVSAAPTASIAGSNTICPATNTVLTFTGTAAGKVAYTDGTTTYTVTLSGVSGVGTATVAVAPVVNTTYSLINIVSGGTYTLSGTATVTISNPVITSIGADASVCEGGTLNLNTAISGGTAPYTYSWTGDNDYAMSTSSTAITNSVTVSSISATPSTPLYTIVVTDSVGCIATGTNTVTSTVISAPVVAAITGATTVCSGATTALTDATTGGVWSSASAAIATIDASGNVTGIAGGNALISYAVTNSCGVTTAGTASVTVTTAPAAGIITGAVTVCTGSVTTLSDTATGGTWASASPATASVDASGNVAGIATGTALISYTTTNTCGNTSDTITVTVNTAPVPLAISGTLTENVGGTTTLHDATTGGVWSSANPSIATVNTSGVVSGLSAGTATISYLVSNSCGSGVATATVTVSLGAVAAISGTQWNGTGTNGVGASTFSVVPAATTPGSPYVVVSQWNRAGSVGLATGAGAYYNSVSFSTATDSATAVAGSAYLYFTITNGSSTEVNVSNVTVVGQRSGTGPQNYAMVYSTGGNNMGFGSIFNVASTTTTINPTFTGNACIAPGQVATFKFVPYTTASAGTFRILNATSLTATYINGVTALATTTPTNSSPVCSGSSVSLTGGTASNGVAPYSYSWAGPGAYTSTATAPVIPTTTVSGTYTFSVTDNMGCVASAVTTTTVTPLPNAGVITGVMAANIGSATTLADTVSGGTWSSASPAIATVSTGGVVTGIATGTSVISYSVTNSCGTTVVTATVTITPVPFAAGNLVVYQVNSITSGAKPISLVQYTTTGSLVSTATLPSTGVNDIVEGDAASDGAMTLDAERTHLILPGYDTVGSGVGSGSVAGSLKAHRVIYSVLPSMAAIEVANVAQTYVDSGNNFRGATANGSNYYGAGTAVAGALNTAGVQLMSGTTASQVTSTVTVTNVESVEIFNGQLYIATAKATIGVYAVGTGIPTSSGNATVLVAQDAVGSGPSPYAFSISPDGNTLYIADGTSGLLKYTRTGGTGTFTYRYVVNSAACSGLTVDYSTTNNTLYATTVATPSALISVVDAGAASSMTSLATSGAAAFFRGVMFTPAASAKITATVANACSGAADSIKIYGNPNATVNYTIGGTAGSIALGDSGFAQIGLSTATMTNTTASPVALTCSLVSITSSLGTTALSGSTVITIQPAVAAITGTHTVCIGATTALADATTGGTWSSVSSSVATVDPSSGIVTGIAAGIDTIKYTAVATCGTQSAYTLVTVNPTPNAGTITGVATAAVGGTTTLSDTVTGGSWSSSDITLATVSTSGVVTGIAVGTPTISYTYITACGTAYATYSVVISSMPFATIGGTATVCPTGSAVISFNGTSGATVSYTTNGAPSSDITLDGTGTYTMSVSPAVTTTYSLTAITSGAYSGPLSGSAVITISTLPSISSVSGDASVCAGTTLNLNVAISAGTSSSFTYLWSGPGAYTATTAGTTATTNSVTVASVAATPVNPVYTVMVTDGFGCIATGANTVTTTVNNVPDAPSAITGITTTIIGGNTTLADATAGGTWSSSSVSVATVSSIGGVTGISLGSSVISYTFINGCGTTAATATVTITAAPFGSGNLVVFEANGTSSGGTAISLLEYNTAGSLVSTNALPSTGTNEIVCSGSATSEGGMALDAERTHLMVPGYAAAAGLASVASAAGVNRVIYSVLPSMTATEVASLPQTAIYSGNNIRSATANGTNYYAGGTSSASTLNLAGVELMGASAATEITSTVTVTNVRVVQIFNGQLYLSSGAGSSTGVYAVGTGIPTTAGNAAVIAYTGMPTSSLTPSPYSFSISADGNTMYVVDDALGILKYTRAGATGNFSYQYIVNSTACRGVTVDYSTTPYTIYATTAAASLNSLIKVIDLGASSASATLASATTGNIFRGVSFAPSAAAKILATTGIICSGTADSIKIYGNPNATVNYTIGGAPASVVLGASGFAQIGLGVLTNTTATATTLTCSLVSIVTSLGTTSLSGNAVITIEPAVVAITGTPTVCAGSATTLADASAGGTWSSISSSIATVDPSSGVVTAIAAGIDTVKYTVISACGSQFVYTLVTVNPLPSAGAIIGATAVAVGSTTTLSDTVTGGTWTSSDATLASIDASGMVTGIATGSPVISYTITNGCGTAYTTFTVNVTSSVYATISGTAAICAGSATSLTFSGTAGATVSYTDGSGTYTVTLSGTSGVGTDTVTVSPSVSTTYSLISMVSAGSTYTVTGTATVTVNAIPAATTTPTGADPICAGSNATLTAASGTGYTYQWYSSGTSVSGATSAVYVTSVSGSYSVVVAAAGCTATSPVITVSINSLPTASVTGTATIASGSPATLMFTGTPLSTVTYTANSASPVNFTFDGTGVYTVAVTPSVSTLYTITLVTNTATGCAQTITGQSATITVLLPYTQGNLVVEQPNGSTSAGTAIMLSQYTTSGALVGSNILPSTGTSQIVMSGSATSEGLLSLSAERDRLIVVGYDAPAGTASVANSTIYNREIGEINVANLFTKKYSSSSPYLDSNNVRSGTSFGNDYFIASAARGVNYISATTVYSLTTAANVRYLQAYNNSLYFTAASGAFGLCQMSGATGSPISAAAAQTFTVVAADATSAYGFAISPDGNTAYIADATHGILKYTRSGGAGNFTAASYTVYPTACTGIAVDFSTTNPTIYATLSSGLSLLKMTDAGAAATPVVIATTASSTPFRGVMFAPYANAGITLSGSSTVCSGHADTLVFKGNPYGVVAYSINGAGSYSVTLDSAGRRVLISTSTPGTYTYNLVSITNPSGTTALSAAPVTITVASQQWAGATSTDWNTGSNWTCGTIPLATDSVVIPSATTFAPVITSSVAVAQLNIIGAILTIDTPNSLGITGSIINNGTITGEGSVILNGSSIQTITGSGKISNLTLANALGAIIIDSIATDTMGITGTLLLNSGTLTTNGKLMLASDASGSGRIGTITGGSVSGNVIIQQYVVGLRRAYRFIAHPFSSAIPLSQIENTIDITGTGGHTNGFTTTASNASSSYWYNTAVGNSALGTDPGWTAFSSTNGIGANAFNSMEGIRLYFRGSQGQGLVGETYTVNPATYVTYGPVNQGPLTITLIKGTGLNEDYNLIGNPYPSIVDIGRILDSMYVDSLLTGASFYVWDPQISTSGQFKAITIGSTGSSSGPTHYYLGANESFEIRTRDNGTPMPFAETDKSTAVSDMLMRQATTELLTLSVYDNTYHLWDELNIRFTDLATDKEDIMYDGAKPPSPASLNFYSLSSDSAKLSLDSRPFAEGKIIPLGIKSSYAQDFIIKADNVAVPNGGQLYLHDKLLKTYTLMSQGAEYKFTITGNAASQGDQRFELGTNAADVATTQNATGLDVQMVPNPATDEVNISYNATSKEPTTIRLINVEGVTILTKDMGTQQSGSTKISLASLASGVYIVEFTSGNNKVIHRLIKE